MSVDITQSGNAQAVNARFVGDTMPMPPRSTWKYLQTNSPPANWNTLAFDDSGWSSGNAPFGDPSSPCVLPESIGTTWDGSTDILLRFKFTWPTVEFITNVIAGFCGAEALDGGGIGFEYWNDDQSGMLAPGFQFHNCPVFTPDNPAASPPNTVQGGSGTPATIAGVNLFAVRMVGFGNKTFFDMTLWDVWNPPIQGDAVAVDAMSKTISGDAVASDFSLVNIYGDAFAVNQYDNEITGDAFAVIGIFDLNISGDCYARRPPLAPGQNNLLSKWKQEQRDALIQKPCTTCGGIDCTDTEIVYSLEGVGFPLVPVCPPGVDCSKFGSGFHLQCCDGTRYDYNFSPQITDEQKQAIIANAMADCARKLPFCTNNCPNPPCAPPCLVPPCIIYGNNFATCPAECASGGGTFTETVPAGTYFAFTQIEADQIAIRAACALAKDHKLCILGLEAVTCVNVEYSDDLVASGRYVAAYPSSDTISVIDGALPNGIELNGGSSFITGGRCKLEGIPTVPGTYTFTIQIVLGTFGSPGYGDRQQRTFTIKVCAITPDTLPDAKIGVDYDQALFVTPDHDTSTEVWTLITSLPAGLELDPDGFITGKPTGPSESHNVTVKCCFTLDSEPVCCTKQYTLTVNEGTCTEQTVVPYQATGWKYLQIGVDTAPPANYETVAFDDSGWTDGQAAFGEGPDIGVPCPLISTVHTVWTRDTRMVLRKHITLAAGTKNLRLRFSVDNDVLAIWFNGVLLGSNLHHDFCPSLPNFEKMAADGSLIVGDNVVAVLCRDHYLVAPPNGDQSFFDLSVVACVI